MHSPCLARWRHMEHQLNAFDMKGRGRPRNASGQQKTGEEPGAEPNSPDASRDRPTSWRAEHGYPIPTKKPAQGTTTPPALARRVRVRSGGRSRARNQKSVVTTVE